MKKLALIILVVSILTGSTESCLKEDSPAVNEPDSGYYDPTSYFPLKWGAKWLYESSTGDTIHVECGPHRIDTLRQYQYSYAYHYHTLNSGSGYSGPTNGIVPYYNGTKYWKAQIVGDMCIKGSPFTRCFMMDGSGSPGFAFKCWWCGSAGPNYDEYCFSLDSAIQIDGYSNVYSFCFEYRDHLELVLDTLKSQPNSSTAVYHLPILPKAGKTMGKVYYARGVGVIRKELINDQGQVVDYIRLVSYHFP